MASHAQADPAATETTPTAPAKALGTRVRRTGTSNPTMQRYANPRSGVAAFRLHPGAIDIEFRDGKRYHYNATIPGPEAVATMQHLALEGRGLATYINQHVRDRFAHRLPSRRSPSATPSRRA